MTVIDEMCPLKQYKVAQSKEPWVTNEILELIKDKDRLLRRAKNRNTQIDWDLARTARNNANFQIRRAKANFVQENINVNQNNSKKFWQNIKDVLPNSKNSQHSKISLKNNDNIFINDNKDMANQMNEYFTTTGPSLAANMNDPWVHSGPILDTSLVDIFHVEHVELIELLSDIDFTKSSAIEYLSSTILKDALITLIDQFRFILNLSFSQGIFPDKWKISQITPLPKDGDLSLCNNYRPISLLPLPGKIAEKIAHSRISQYLETNEILNKKQGGFRKNNSTINSVSEFTHEIFTAINSTNISLATLIDFSKAFDTVNHQILFKKLKHYGIQNKNLEWLQNYLLNRQQCTSVNGSTSDLSDITCGVPQGSILGPLLFLIYINDLSDVISNTSMYLYADYTVLLSINKDIHDCYTNIQSDLAHINLWCRRNKLSLNIKKTKCMLFGSRVRLKNSRCPKLNINDVNIDFVHQYKYLGVILDPHLTFNKHLNNIIKITAHKINLLAKVRQYLTETASLRIYKTMILPYFDYGDILYDSSSKKLLDKLDGLQHRAVKICLKPVVEIQENILLRSTNIAKLGKRRDAHLLNLCLKRKLVYTCLILSR